MLHANFMALCFVEPEAGVAANGSFTLLFDLFCCCDLDLDSMTFICTLDPYSLEIYRMCKYEFPTLRLSKVIV